MLRGISNRVTALLFVFTSLCFASDVAPESAPWVEVGKENGITISRRKLQNDPVFAYRGEGTLEASIGKIISVALDVPRRVEWVNRLEVARVVRDISPNHKIIYMKVRAPWPVNDRDFLVDSVFQFDPKKQAASFDMKSVEDPTVPPDRCCVRAHVSSNHIELKATSDKRTEVVAEAHVDPKGSLPAWLVNLVQKTFPRKTLEGLLKQVNKPDISDYLEAHPKR
mgnify:CR=1 FL=1